MTDHVMLPGAEEISDTLEILYKGSVLSTRLAPQLIMHAGKVLDADGVAGVIYEACNNIAAWVAHSEDPIEVGDYETIAMVLCKGCGSRFIDQVVRIISDIERLEKQFALPPAPGH